MKPLLTSLLLVICLCGIAVAQDDADAQNKKVLAEAAKKGNGLQTDLTVNGNVHAQAVLIPRVDARRIFGKNIAENYAVVEVNVGNKSENAALIIHGVFIDYSKWPLSGSSRIDATPDRSTDRYQASNFPTQVASEEYRVVRGQLLDAQTDTLRNRILRYLTWAGNLAGAFTFSLNEQGIVKGIAAANGVGIPGFATAFPDKTIDQLNRVSDFGFRANKVIPKEASDIIVCFFPIDRFLTPGFRKLFLKSPALFFAPLQMLVDRTADKDVAAILNPVLSDQQLTVDDLRGALPCYMQLGHPDNPAFNPCLDEFGLEKNPHFTDGRLRVKSDAQDKYYDWAYKKFKKVLILQFLAGVSLNRVTITVDGTMAVDVNTVAARIDGVEMNSIADCGDANGECFWNNLAIADGVRTGVIRGAYLKGGEISIAEASDLHIDEVKKVDDGSSDDELHFSFKLGAAVDNQKKLTFVVTKPPASEGGKKLESNSWVFPVTYSPSANSLSSMTPTLSSDKKTLTIKGKGFTKATKVTLVPEFGKSVKIDAASVKWVDAGQLDVTLPTLSAGCWYAQVETGGVSSNRSPKFRIDPNPSLDAAERNDNFIFVNGTDLVDFSHCGGDQVKFQLTKPDGSEVTDLTVDNWSNGQPRLVLPAKAKTDNWKVQILLGTTVKNSVDLKVRGQ